ncbi:hypothetical protein D3C78_1881530 [compost metagenome]
MPVLGHQPRLELGRQRRLGGIQRRTSLAQVFCLKGVNRRFSGAPPGVLGLLAQGVVGALGDTAQ